VQSAFCIIPYVFSGKALLASRGVWSASVIVFHIAQMHNAQIMDKQHHVPDRLLKV
jgi:hypothetical protein